MNYSCLILVFNFQIKENSLYYEILCYYNFYEKKMFGEETY